MSDPARSIKESVASAPRRTRPLRVGLFGSALTTGNRGVTALAYSTIGGLHALGLPLEVTLFDMGRGERSTDIPVQGGSVPARLIGCFESRRYYRPSNLSHLRVANRIGLRSLHPMLKTIGQMDAILDISAGDSFSDIYGWKRFHSIVASKLLALEMGVPLVLTPQTYGPYKSDKAKAIAADIVRRASQVWARDSISMNVVRSLVGDAANGENYRTGVDVAFGLPVNPPKDAKLVDAVTAAKRSNDVLIGLNVSGLLYTNGQEDVKHYGFIDSYREMIDELISRLLSIPGVKLLLIPHVSNATGATEFDCDQAALRKVQARLSDEQKKRVMLIPPELGPTEVKWVIGQCDWFCGTRMHSCIAALSQGVPTIAVAYSDKTQGVFETAHVGEAVVDPRVLHKEEMLDRILDGFNRREKFAAALSQRLPAMKQEWLEEFEAIYRSVT